MPLYFGMKEFAIMIDLNYHYTLRVVTCLEKSSKSSKVVERCKKLLKLTGKNFGEKDLIVLNFEEVVKSCKKS